MGNSNSSVSNNTYDRLKQGAQLVLPAILTLYLALASIWKWDHAQEIGMTIGAVNVFLGVVVTALAVMWRKTGADGTIHVTEQEDGTTNASLVLRNYEDPAAVVEQKEVLFNVSKHGTLSDQ